MVANGDKFSFGAIKLLICGYEANETTPSVLSEYFLATNGVKLGGVFSPVLFCIYIDNLLVQLLKSGFGCYIGNTFVGALAYADDIVLVAPGVKVGWH